MYRFNIIKALRYYGEMLRSVEGHVRHGIIKKIDSWISDGGCVVSLNSHHWQLCSA